MSQEIMHIAMNSVEILDVNKSCVDDCSKCLELETELLKKKDFIKKDVFNKLVKSYSTLKSIAFLWNLQLNLIKKFFKNENSDENQNAPTFNQLFEINELKAQSQEKDTVIRKLKDIIKSLMEKEGVENVKKDIDEIETINIEMEHSVPTLLSENENLRKEREHLKCIFKDQFDSIKQTHLNAQLQEKVFAITTLKNELRKLKGKDVMYSAVSKTTAFTISPGMFKINLEPLAPMLLKNKDAHIDYINHSKKNTDILRELVEIARALSPLDSNLDSACKYVQRIQEVLFYVKETCPCLSKPSEKFVAVTPMNKDKRVRFAEALTYSSITQKPQDSNKHLLNSTRVNCSTSASGSKPLGNTKNNRISQSSSSNMTNKVEDQSRSVWSRVNKESC
nr:hypothetical protein [Tanacetum cinerariifolium]